MRVVADIAGRLLPTAALLVGRRRLLAASGVKAATALLFLGHVVLGRAAPRRAPGPARARARFPGSGIPGTIACDATGWSGSGTAAGGLGSAACDANSGMDGKVGETACRERARPWRCEGRARLALMRPYTHGTPQRHTARGRARRWRSDAAALLFVGAFWAASGLLSAAAYVAAQAWAPPGCGGRAGGLMALVFQARPWPGLRLAPAGHLLAGR